MVTRFILAGIAVVLVAGWPRSRVAAAAALGAGTLSGGIFAAGVAAAPMLVFLTAALGFAALMDRAGLAAGAVTLLARRGGGSTRRLYVLVCAAAALLTAVISLDGAVVLMVPVVSALARRCRIAFAPFFLGVVVVANAASLAVPEGNPTNLVIMSRLGLSPEAFLFHLFVPGLCAAVLCALVPARRLKPQRYAIYAADESRSRQRVFLIPWRIGAQLVGLLAALQGLAPSLSLDGHGFFALLIVAAGTAGAAAVVNNLPVSAAVATLVTAGPGAYAALIGLTVGALATPHGSVATMIARDLAGEDGKLPSRSLVSASALAVLGATFLLWATIS
jgi:Na+/H+ antiporter NhaD/arsenite permease-like protein